MTEPFIGEIKLVGFNFAPRGYMFCHGQILPIALHTALFSILGTTYGGNGQTTFALPDLRGRAPVHQGQGPGLSSYSLGEVGGIERVTLTAAQLPQHTHQLSAVTAEASTNAPAGNMLAATHKPDTYAPAPANAQMHSGSIAPEGGSQPHENRQPFMAMNYVIAVEGIFPPRS